MENKSNITEEMLSKCNDIISKINNYYSAKMVGQEKLRKSLLLTKSSMKLKPGQNIS